MNFLDRLYKNAGLIFPLIATFIGLAMAGFIEPYLAFIATSWLISGLLGLSLDIVWGRGGFLSLGQTVAYGLGGYFGSIIAINLAPITGNSLIWALPVGAICGALAAVLLGYIIFYARMGALQSTILSYTFTLLLWSVSQSFKLEIGDAVIGGDNGLSNIPGFVIGFGKDAQALEPNHVFALMVIICAAIYFLTRLLMKSYFGRIIDCIRIDAQKTELLGYDIRKYQLLNFAYSGAVAGIAGAMFGLWANYLNPSLFSVQAALLVPIYVLIGGLGTLSGGFVGALTIGGLSFWLGSGAVGGQTTLVLGIVLVLLVMFLKNGILGGLDWLWRFFLTPTNEDKQPIGKVKIDADIIEEFFTNGRSQKFSIESLSKQFGGVTPVDDISYMFQSGRPYALIGPNGAGKSSLLKTCIGLYKADEGRVFLNGKDMTNAQIFSRVQNGMGVKNQRPQVYDELTILQNLWSAAYARTRDNEQALQIAEQILNMLGFAQQSSVNAKALSHGQQQWIDIGMMLCLAPSVVFLDEPAAGMTPEETRELSLLIRELAKYCTVIVVEHNMDFVDTLAAYVIVLHQGKIFAKGDIETLRTDDRVLDIYLGRRAADA